MIWIDHRRGAGPTTALQQPAATAAERQRPTPGNRRPGPSSWPVLAALPKPEMPVSTPTPPGRRPRPAPVRGDPDLRRRRDATGGGSAGSSRRAGGVTWSGYRRVRDRAVRHVASRGDARSPDRQPARHVDHRTAAGSAGARIGRRDRPPGRTHRGPRPRRGPGRGRRGRGHRPGRRARRRRHRQRGGQRAALPWRAAGRRRRWRRARRIDQRVRPGGRHRRGSDRGHRADPAKRWPGGTQPRTVSLGQAGDRYFTFNAGMGIDADVVERVEERRAAGQEDLQRAARPAGGRGLVRRRPQASATDASRSPARNRSPAATWSSCPMSTRGPISGDRPIRTNPGTTAEGGLGVFAAHLVARSGGGHGWSPSCSARTRPEGPARQAPVPVRRRRRASR